MQASISFRQILNSPVHLLAFGFGAGLAPKAPGTIGTLVAIPLFLLLQPLGLPAYLAVTAVLFLFGCWLCGESARRLGAHDHAGIVWDEIVAFLLTMAPLLLPLQRSEIIPDWGWLALGFALFRFFDVLKPWPINLADRRVHGGFGIMLDDLLAAGYAGLLLSAALYASQTWPGPRAVFDYDQVFAIAGEHVPPEREAYYLFDITGYDNDPQAARELAEYMVRTHDEQEYLGILGTDNARNRRVTEAALVALEGQRLGQATIIYLGAARDEQVLRGRAEALGARFVFTRYP